MERDANDWVLAIACILPTLVGIVAFGAQLFAFPPVLAVLGAQLVAGGAVLLTRRRWAYALAGVALAVFVVVQFALRGIARTLATPGDTSDYITSLVVV